MRRETNERGGKAGRRWAVALAAILSIHGTSVCQGALTLQATLSRDPLAGAYFYPANNGLNNPPYDDDWVSYVLAIESSDEEELITSIDATIRGDFHQRWNRRPADGVGVPTSLPDVAGTINDESHFLLSPVDAASGIIYEDNNTHNDLPIARPLPDNYFSDFGVGSYLRGNWAIGAPRQSPSMNFAYVVIPRHSIVSGGDLPLDYIVDVGTSKGNITRFQLGNPNEPAIPPAPSPLPPGPPYPPSPAPGPAASSDYVLTARLARDPHAGRNFTTDLALNEAPTDGWVSYVLNLTNVKGVKIAGIDAALGGVFHQRWNIVQQEDPEGNPIEVVEKTAAIGGVTSGDSHLLVPSGGDISVVLDENSNYYLDPMAAPDTSQRDYGAGTYLRGIYAIPGSQQSSSVDFAYIVIPRGSESHLRLFLQFALRDGSFYELRERNIVFIPEPATLSLVGLAVMVAAGTTPRRRPRFRQSPESFRVTRAPSSGLGW
jgi:hypothetical protein